MATTASNPHVRGPARYRKLPRFTTKPTTVLRETVHRDGTRHLVHDSGGGYESIRSYEADPRKGGRKHDVRVAVHRLCAVAWCYPDDWSVREILADLDGSDVHHNAPECEIDRGVEWDNRECVLEVMDHGSHAALTNHERRAYAEDDKRRATQPDGASTPTCDACGDESDTLCVSPDWSGEYCPPCAGQASEGAPIEVT